ncbi:protein XNDC1N isoform X2 [Dendrobates tinctorius]|uniref:protein XNDC1N isoform X2 n=1 Tax=Dendrobates tinctorius TaxID=92724 RepID=UPI003CCA642A
MAPVTIRHIVSFSSQDPKHPVENLLIDNLTQPWLSCPRDRSRQLRVELQLDRACHIGYIDIGNSGSAFLQIDVGRSIWALDKGFTTLLPTTTLMPPEDARVMKNHIGVRMFKEGDFLTGAALEKWDRVRVTCTQPFNKQEQFGLSFIRVRSAPDEEDEEQRAGSGGGRSCPVSPLHSVERPTLDAQDPEAWRQKLRDKLQSAASPPLASMSRSARMLLLSAAKSRKRRPPITAASNPPILPCCENSASQQGDSPVSSGSCPETPMTRLHPSKKEHETPNRRLKMEETRRRKRAQTRTSERHLTPRRDRDRPSTALCSPETDTNTCPICAGHFPPAQLLLHAASCGEASVSHCIDLSSSDDDWDDSLQLLAAPHRSEPYIQCPLCGFPFQEDEIEGHASRCGE